MLKEIKYSFFIFSAFIYDCSLESLIREQYELAKKGISVSESNELSLFEREGFISLILTEKKKEAENPLFALINK